MKKFFLVVLLSASFAGCAGNAPPNLTPANQVLYTNTQRIQALDILRDSAIDANSKMLLSTDTTRRVVQGHEDILKLINAQSSGWMIQAKIIASGILVQLPKAESDILTPLVNSVLASLQ